jgi:hypothetical protein
MFPFKVTNHCKMNSYNQSSQDQIKSFNQSLQPNNHYPMNSFNQSLQPNNHYPMNSLNQSLQPNNHYPMNFSFNQSLQPNNHYPMNFSFNQSLQPNNHYSMNSFHQSLESNNDYSMNSFNQSLQPNNHYPMNSFHQSLESNNHYPMNSLNQSLQPNFSFNQSIQDSNETLRIESEREIGKKSKREYDLDDDTHPPQKKQKQLMADRLINKKLNEMKNTYKNNHSNLVENYINLSNTLFSQYKDRISHVNKYKIVQNKGDCQSNKSMWKNNYIELVRILNPDIKYIIHMTHNSTNTSSQDQRRMKNALKGDDYIHISLNDIRNIGLKHLNEKAIKIVYTIANVSNLESIIDKLENCNPDHCLCLVDESDTCVKAERTRFWETLQKAEYNKKFCQIVRYTATPLKDFFVEEIDDALLIPKSPEYKGIDDCDKYDFEILENVEHIKHECESVHAVINKKLSKQDKEKLMLEIENTHIICEMDNDKKFLYVHTSSELLKKEGFQNQKYNEKECYYINLNSMQSDDDILSRLHKIVNKKLIYVSNGSSHDICSQSELPFKTIPILSDKNIEMIVNETKDRLNKHEFCGSIVNIAKEKDKHLQIINEISESIYFNEIKNSTLLTVLHDNIFSIFKKNLTDQQILQFTNQLNDECNRDDDYIKLSLKNLGIDEILHGIKIHFKNYCFILVGHKQLDRGVSFCSKKTNDKDLCVKTIFIGGCIAYDSHNQMIGRILGECRPDIKPRIYQKDYEEFKECTDNLKIFFKDSSILYRSSEQNFRYTGDYKRNSMIMKSGKVKTISKPKSTPEKRNRNRTGLLGYIDGKEIHISHDEITTEWYIKTNGNTIECFLSQDQFTQKFGNENNSIKIQSNLQRNLIISDSNKVFSWKFRLLLELEQEYLCTHLKNVFQQKRNFLYVSYLTEILLEDNLHLKNLKKLVINKEFIGKKKTTDTSFRNFWASYTTKFFPEKTNTYAHLFVKQNDGNYIVNPEHIECIERVYKQIKENK